MTQRNQNHSEYRVPNELAQSYLSRYEGLTLAASTADTYDSHLTEFVRFLQDNEQTVLSAEVEDIIEYVESCVRRGNRQSTISGKLSTIQELYRYIRLRTESGSDLELDPIELREINIEQYNTPEKIEREALSRKEIKQLFDAFQSYRNRLMAIVGVETGLRNSDIRNLRIEDLDKDTIHVSNPKGSKPYDVPISDELRFELNHWLQQHRRGFAASAESEFVFPSQHGEKLKTNGSLNTIVKNAAERAGIQETIGTVRIPESQREVIGADTSHRRMHRVTVHTLRHSFITLLSNSEVELEYRRLAANHESVDTTLEYDHSEKDVFEPLRDRFDPPR
jgi:integrase/recombinase XerD